MLTFLPENSSSGNRPAPCKHLAPHPLNKTCYGDCLHTATANTTLLKFTAPSIGLESPQGKEQRQWQQLCVFKGQRGLGRLGGEKHRSNCPLDSKPVQYSYFSGFELDTDHAGFIDRRFQDVSIKSIRALRWRHHLNIPKLILNEKAETLTGIPAVHGAHRALHCCKG